MAVTQETFTGGEGFLLPQGVDISGGLALGETLTPVEPTQPLLSSEQQALVLGNLGLANFWAGKYVRLGMEAEDLQQVACMGLVKAAKRFDPDREVAFSTYATATVIGELRRHLRDTSWGAGVPRSVKELSLNVAIATEELTDQLKREPTKAELAAHLEVSEASVSDSIHALRNARIPASLDAPSRSREWLNEKDDIADEAALYAEEETIADKAMVESLLSHLSGLVQEVVRLRFWEEKTQNQIAQELGVSQMHVSRLLQHAFDILRPLLEK